MHSFEYILVMLFAVLFSNLVSLRFPRISAPLVQIALGVAIALLPIFHFDSTLDPEFFLVLFIAPLLFEDAKKADKPTLWRLKKPILLLALGLVFATCLAVGAFMDWLIPALGLPAAFAFAAALAPTDAVAVGSLKESAEIDDDQRSLLQGEALFNDASSIVSFQFALAALAVGPYSAAAGLNEWMFVGTIAVTFLVMFLGGVLVGVGLMLLRSILVKALRASGMENTTFHVLFELLTPFLVFLIAEGLHVSGIIAVVAAGIMHSFARRMQTPENARQNIVSSSVWSVTTFSLNGIVFLILGTQLPGLTIHVWQNSAAEHLTLILAVLFGLLAILAMRFVWVFVMRRNALIAAPDALMVDRVDRASQAPLEEKLEDDGLPPEHLVALDLRTIEQRATERIERFDDEREERRTNQGDARASARTVAKTRVAAEHRAPGYFSAHLKDALLLTLTGAKGAITLALLLTIPLSLPSGADFPERNLLLFVASGIIVLSLLIANFVVSLIAPRQPHEPAPEEEQQAILEIFRSVIRKLNEQLTAENRRACDLVIFQYNSRLQKAYQDTSSLLLEEDRLRGQIINWERDHTLHLIDTGKLTFAVGTAYVYQLGRLLARVEHHGEKRWLFIAFYRQLVHSLRDRRRYLRAHSGGEKLDHRTMRVALVELQEENHQMVLQRLNALKLEQDHTASLAAIERVSEDIKRNLERLRTLQRPRGAASRESQADLDFAVLDIEAKALHYEREAIEHYFAAGHISRTTARNLRDNVAIMEIDIENQLE